MNTSFSSLILTILIMSTTIGFSQKTKITNVEWKKAEQLQNADGSLSLGFAGPINGISNNVLIVAGGANFPDKMPWEGGKKHYSNEIHVLEKAGDNFLWNKKAIHTLPEPIAYPGNVSTNSGIVYVGGENENGLSNKAYLLNWNADKNEVETKSLPDFPIAITNIALTHLENIVYAIGGDEAKQSSDLVFSLDLNAEKPEWKLLTKLPFALANSVSVIQNNTIYVIGGRTKTPSGISDLHNTTLAFDLKKQIWETKANISDGKQTTNFSAGAGVAIGTEYILILGGDNGTTFHKIETYLSQIASATSEEEKAKLIAEKNILNTTHKGFYNDILLYNTHTNKWSKIGELPFLSQVTTTATIWNDKIVLSNGEIKPGIRTPDVMLGTIK
ncbi:N-acetylneuraminate epimerase [Flavobacterium bizetiae]|uniref:N-acetylneuraminate epimerase n=1 Tax=Flavobacterium bizetiae TaxID=2704140 RepID=A0A6J4G7B1_9FLAO|nr:galactose oxidase [Flavobacterium bizetiae]CAA9194258.1 N-acetylneuraminate epimerase [Flavobacterium bizetiae]CAD5340418.1 N-acetylneuraminate epimerase [Flavobacterium bizetiae]CAD5346820.1 N-acetylneuraminate epimerase [Flavobacterium bizetiae]